MENPGCDYRPGADPSCGGRGFRIHEGDEREPGFYRRAAPLSVSRFLFLDSAPLGLITHPQRSTRVAAITEWLSRCILNGHRVVVPAIVYYELKRELLRAK